jgi:SpoU rRNA methylase family enzyme
MAALGFVGRMATKSAIGRAADELAERLSDQTEQAIDTAVRLRAPALAAGVEIERRLYPDLAPDLFLAHLVRRRAKMSAAVGAVTAVPAVMPGVGSVVAIGSSLADAGALLYSEVALIVELCAATGRQVADTEMLTVDVLIVLARGAGVAVPEALLAEARRGAAHTSEIPRATLAELNRGLGGQVVKRVARRRARMILGRELPFGVGVALGGIGNYRAMHALGRTAIKHLQGK